MATVFEIVDKLRAGEEVVISNKYKGIVMQQMSDHKIGDIIVSFEPSGKNHTKMVIAK